MKKKPVEPVFTKEQLKNAREFFEDKDIIEILVDDKKTYTKSEIRQLINSYRNKEEVY